MVTNYRIAALLIVFTMLLSACGYQIKNRSDWEVGEFQSVNQDNQTITLSDLKGKVWIADFMFTSCSTVCPTLTANMAKLQKMMKEEGLDVTFVSFSVDPEVDTPEQLKAYGSKFTSEFSNWNFLTGYEFGMVRDLAYNSFKSLVQKNPNDSQVTHGTSFYLIDQNGKVAVDYKGNVDVPYEQIIKDTKFLLK